LILVTAEGVDMGIKTVTFAKNGNGIDSIKIDTSRSMIYQACRQLPLISGLKYRFTGKNGNRIEYEGSDGYIEIQADIKDIK
jgi:hypothetical protein